MIAQLVQSLGFGLDDQGSILGRGSNGIFSSPPRPYRLWGPPSLLSDGYGGGELTTHHHLVLREYTSTPPHVFMALYLVKHRIHLRGVVLCYAKDNFFLTLYL
jgi:hypothetical protein